MQHKPSSRSRDRGDRYRHGNVWKYQASWLYLPGAVLVFLFPRIRVWGLVVCLAVAAIAAALPFVVVPGASLQGYWELIRAACYHGFSGGVALWTLSLAIFFLSPIAAMLCINLASSRGPKFRRCLKQQLPPLLAILVATLLSLVPAAKMCAGPRHALPLIPIYAFTLGSFISWPRREIGGPRWLKSVALAAVAAFAAIGVSTAFAGMHRLCARHPR